MAKPQPKTYPFTNCFSGGDVSQIRGVTEHYFPSRYEDLKCEINVFTIEIKNFRQMEITTRFKILGDESSIKGLYEDEGWKFMRTENLLERYPNEAKRLSTPAPLFCLMLNKYLQVVGATIKRLDGRPTDIVFDTDADMLTMPTSFPPLADMAESDYYVYYNKKATVFYSDIQLGVEYEIKVLLEANAGTFEFAPLFPFGEVLFSKISTITNSEYEISPSAIIVRPEISREFPEWFQYQLDKLTSHEIMTPHFRPAYPERGTFPLFDMSKEFEDLLRETSKDKILKMLEDKEVDLSKSIKLDAYKTLRFGFSVLIPQDKNIDVVVRSIRRPLPPRIYEQMQKLPNYRDVLVEYDVFNLSKNKLRLRIETEIVGYTEKETKTIFVHGINNQKNQKARKVLSQCPRLKKNVLEELIIPAKATLHCKVINEDTRDTLFEETFPVDILQNDEMVWELVDLRSNQTYNLRDFICAWITPVDKEGLLDKVRSEARSFHPDNTLGHSTQTLGDVMAHVKAIYDYLSKEGLNYLSQPFSSKTSENSQRVVLPEKVIKNKAGNCIDLTVLFASILEGFGIYSLIFLTPTHAFIGWGNKNREDQMFFLETTLIGRNDFNTAVESGRRAFESSFMMNGGSKPLYMPELRRIDGNFIVDMQKARHSGQISVRK